MWDNSLRGSARENVDTKWQIGVRKYLEHSDNMVLLQVL